MVGRLLSTGHRLRTVLCVSVEEKLCSKTVL